jgi:hypothetical protein
MSNTRRIVLEHLGYMFNVQYPNHFPIRFEDYHTDVLVACMDCNSRRQVRTVLNRNLNYQGMS